MLQLLCSESGEATIEGPVLPGRHSGGTAILAVLNGTAAELSSSVGNLNLIVAVAAFFRAWHGLLCV